MNHRSNPLLLATVLTAVVGAGALLFGAFLLSIASGAFMSLGGVSFSSLAGVVGAASVLFGVAAVLAAVGLWRSRPWAWLAAAVIHSIVALGLVVAATTGGSGIYTAVGLALAVSGLASLASSAVRESLAISASASSRGDQPRTEMTGSRLG